MGRRTIKTYRGAVKRFLKGRHELTEEGIVTFLQKEKRGYARSALIHFLKSQGKKDIIFDIPIVKELAPLPREIPTYEEFVQVIEKLREEDKMIARFLLNTGARCHEAFQTKLGDIDVKGKIVLKVKGGKYRKIWIPDHFNHELQDYLRNKKGLLDDELIFYTDSKALPETKLNKFWEKLNRVANKAIGKNIQTQDFRRYYGVYLYKRTRDMELVRRLMGHSSIETTQIYIQHAILEKDLEKAKNLLSELES